MTKFAFRDDLNYINEHREAVGRRKLSDRSAGKVKEHLAAIEKHAPNGDDPWGQHRNTMDPRFGSKY